MAVGNAYVFLGFLTPVLTQLSFQSHQLLFSHASVEARGENMPERKVTSTVDQTHYHQVMSPTCSPLSHPGGAWWEKEKMKMLVCKKNTTFFFQNISKNLYNQGVLSNINLTLSKTTNFRLFQIDRLCKRQFQF